MSYAGHLALGVDIGTSTCQAWIANERRADPARISDSGGYAHDHFPSTIVELVNGQRCYGYQAELEAGMDPTAEVHRHYKAYMKSDHPLAKKYLTEEALALFEDMARHYVVQLLPDLKQRCDRWEGKVRLDLAFTFPGGWCSDKALQKAYSQAVTNITDQIQAELTDDQLEIFPKMIEEPVAALFSVEADGPVRSGVPVLMIDAGGGTLDIAVCTRKEEQGVPTYQVEMTRSIGVAGAAMVEAFIRALDRESAISGGLPSNWSKDPLLRMDLERLFREYHTMSGDQIVGELRTSQGRGQGLWVEFSRHALDRRLRQCKQLKKVGKFLDSLLDQYAEVTDEQLLEWGQVFLVGGLARYPLFSELVKERWREVQLVPNSQEAVATGAMEYARKGGQSVTARRTDFILAQRLYKDSHSDEMMFAPLVPAGTKVAAGNGRPYRGASCVRISGNDLHLKLVWTRSERLEDEVLTIFDDEVDFGVPLSAGEDLETIIKFDQMLDIEVTKVHKPTGKRWSTSGVQWRI